MWWNISDTLSYNALFNFIVGNRGAGKTYGCTEWAIKDFLKTGAQFVYLRRYTKEFKNNKNFFNAIASKFPEHIFEVKGTTYIIDEKVAGYGLCLATSKIAKSTSYPDVNKIIFDEFIIDKGVYHYLPDEVTTFLDAYETVARMRENVKVFFLSNAITISNPYFTYFNIALPYGSKRARKGDILIELVQDPEFIEKKKATRFGKLIEGTAYSKYSIDNQFLRDNPMFLGHKTGGARYLFTLGYMGSKYGVWIDYDEGLAFVSYDVDPSCKIHFAATTSDHQPNTMLLKAPRRPTLFSYLVKQYELGNLRFENMAIKNAFMDILNMSRS